MSRSGVRSIAGCYTCRLRKKKCDETHPICTTCSSRSLPCYGYGIRPAWMDGAGQEAEYVKIIKKAAERNYHARRRGWRPAADVVGFGGVGDEMRSGGVIKEGTTCFDAPREQMSAGEQCIGRTIDFGTTNAQDWGLGPGSDQLMLMDSEGDLEVLGQQDLEGLEMEGAYTGLSLRPKTLSDREEMMDTMISPSRAQTYQPSYAPELESQDLSAASSASSISLPTLCGSRAVSLRRSASPQVMDSIWWQSNFVSTYNIRNKAELGLLTHYLDNVFSLQFGFSRLNSPKPVPDRGMGWYLEMLLRCKPFYFATLSISAWHQQLVRTGNHVAIWEPAGGGPGWWSGKGKGKGSRISAGGLSKNGLNWDAERNFVMTLKGLQGVLDELQVQGLRGLELLKLRWHVLGTMCQVLSVEVFRTFGGNWPIHIRAARTFLYMIGSSSYSPSTTPSPYPSTTSPGPTRATLERPKSLDILHQILTDDKHQILTANETTALKHVVTSFVWVDILSRASGIRLSSPSPCPDGTTLAAHDALDYLPLLEDHTLDLSRVMGCENWVFITMAQISLLESALSTTATQHRDPRRRPPPSDLMALDPHGQAAVLEVVLERGLRGLLEAREKIKASSGPGSEVGALELQSSLVTELFALAALIYLHVTLSGAYPWLPRIRDSVARSLTALAALPPELLIRVSWPFAVTGCMVLRAEQREVVRRVVRRAAAGGWNTGTVWKGVVLVRECWRLRGVGEGEGEGEGFGSERRVEGAEWGGEWDGEGEMEGRGRGEGDGGGEGEGEGEGGGVGVEVGWVHAMRSLGRRVLLC